MSIFHFYFPSRHFEIRDVSSDDHIVESEFLTVADLIGPAVGLDLPLFPPRLARSW